MHEYPLSDHLRERDELQSLFEWLVGCSAEEIQDVRGRSDPELQKSREQIVESPQTDEIIEEAASERIN